MTREAALNELLASLFSPEELRAHLAQEREGGGLANALPEAGVSHTRLVSEAVAALRRRGIIDRDFFDNLETARPKRVGDIRKVRAHWLDSARLDRGEVWAEGRYSLVSSLGHGGIGLVWKAIDTQIEAYVALKILHDQHADDRRTRQRFFRGARVLSELRHPAIVPVRSGVEQEGLRFFYIMDYVDGASLDTLVGKRPIAELLGHLMQIGDALGHIHAKGLLHRDIKPTNILVNTQHQAKLIDFDLVTGDAFMAMTTRSLGTAVYSPPEASTNDRKTPAYDVYSLARTVEFVLRGREPQSIELAAIDPVATVDATDAVKEVLRAALRPDAAERTQSVQVFCAALSYAVLPLVLNPTTNRVSHASAPSPANGPEPRPAPAAVQGEPSAAAAPPEPAPPPAPDSPQPDTTAATESSSAGVSFLAILMGSALVALIRHCTS